MTTLKMDPELKAAWVRALRSGEFPQGKGMLHRKINGSDAYCCLGVLCELAAQDGFVIGREKAFKSTDNQYVEYVPTDAPDDYESGVTSYLSNTVAEWAGLSHLTHHNPTNPGVIYNGYTTTLSNLNDDNVPFSVIADIIEDQL